MRKRVTIFALIIGCFAFLFILGAQNWIKDSKVGVKNTPSQIGSKGTISSTVKGYTFNELANAADIIAEVKISEWLKETNEPIQKTFFKAKFLNIYKSNVGEDLQEIILMQRGNSEYTIKDYPLFQNDDKLVLFLKKATDIENTYWILGEHTTVLKTCTVDNKEYFIKEVGDFPELKDIQILDDIEKSKIKENIKPKMLEFSSLVNNDDIPQSFEKEQFNKKIKEYIK